MTPRDCIHGRLARSCEICELTALIAEKDTAFAKLQGRYDSLRRIFDEFMCQNCQHGKYHHMYDQDAPSTAPCFIQTCSCKNYVPPEGI